MRVATLMLENFRGIKAGFVRFHQHTVLVATNNVGKSTVIEALTLLLGRDRLIRELTEHDFYGSNPGPEDRIHLIATITDFGSDDPDQHSEWFREGRAVPKWLDEKTGAVHPARTDGAWRLCCQIAAQAYFDSDSLTVEMIRYFHDHDNPIDPFSGDAPVAVPGRLIQQFGYFLVRANRSWDKVFTWGSELFRRTVQAAAAQPATAILAERDRLRNPAHPIEDDAHISPLIENVNREIGRCISGAPKLKLRLTSTDSRSVLDAVSAHFAVPGGVSIPAARQGSGLISLQGLMLLLELGRLRAASGDGFIMALEEPEIHISPATQQQLVHRVQSLSTQTFITTHSPLVAALANPTSVLILRNVDGTLTAEPFLEAPLLPATQAWERRFFQQNRADVLSALMYPQILVPEGKADFYLLRTVLRPLNLTEGWGLALEHAFGLEVGVVPTEDAKVIETYRTLSRIHCGVCCLVDGDGDGLRYAAGLLAMAAPPRAIVRWNDGAMIEDAVGWILEAGGQEIIDALSGLTEPPLQSVGQVVQWLKTKKVDLVSYEIVADAIANNEACKVRAARLFSDLAAACKGQESALFQSDALGVKVFYP